MITKRLIKLAINGNRYAIDRVITGVNPFKTAGANYAVEQFRAACFLSKEGYLLNCIPYGQRALDAIDNYEGQPLPWDFHGEKPLTTEYLNRRYGDCWRW